MPDSDVNYFTAFKAPIDSYCLPEKFTFPFYYQPHPLCILAVEELQYYLSDQTEWQHYFGLGSDDCAAMGKMFGVLLVRDSADHIGYLSAFSGKLIGKNHHSQFVPPVFDNLEPTGFFMQGQRVLNQLSQQIKKLESNPRITLLEQQLKNQQQQSNQQLQLHRSEIITARKQRKLQRLHAEKNVTAAAYSELAQQLAQQSVQQKLQLRDLKLYWAEQLQQAEQAVELESAELVAVIAQRQQHSAFLQQQLFSQYRFLNQQGSEKDLIEIFATTSQQVPPSAAGECAAPKLLQHAFKSGLTPLAMAEFWWGQSPKSKIRKHQQFYPACQGKCAPILSHMLEGMRVDDNPLLTNLAKDKNIAILYEDEHMLVIDKPAELLSVSGTLIKDSVYTRIKACYPQATGSIIVHRLDMQTSGLLLIALSKQAHKNLQRQFIKRTIKKRYVAVLDGLLQMDSGMIELPLRVDLDDRPRQLVCYQHGKVATTRWQVIERDQGRTKVYFYPITGRTHQLRVHAAHINGLNIPIIGDDLYGQHANRLHLHAESIEFTHPISRKPMTFQLDADF